MTRPMTNAREGEGDDDLAGHREGVGDQAERFENSTNMNSEKTKGKKRMPACPRARSPWRRRIRRPFRPRLQARGHDVAAGGAENHQRR